MGRSVLPLELRRVPLSTERETQSWRGSGPGTRKPGVGPPWVQGSSHRLGKLIVPVGPLGTPQWLSGALYFTGVTSLPAWPYPSLQTHSEIKPFDTQLVIRARVTNRRHVKVPTPPLCSFPSCEWALGFGEERLANQSCVLVTL